MLPSPSTPPIKVDVAQLVTRASADIGGLLIKVPLAKQFKAVGDAVGSAVVGGVREWSSEFEFHEHGEMPTDHVMAADAADAAKPLEHLQVSMGPT